MTEDIITFDTPFIAIEYIKLNVPKILNEDALYKIILQAQGESVSIEKDVPVNIAAAIFSKVYSVADELVINNKENYVLIFDHQSKNVLRPKHVDTKVWDIVKKIEEPDKKDKPTEKEILNVDKLWNIATSSTTDEQDQILIFISHVTGKVKYTKKLFIMGTIPTVALLSLLHFVRPFAVEVFYNDIEVFKASSL